MRYGWEELISTIISLALGCLLVWMVTMIVYKFAASADCLEAGYPETKITWKYDAYCVTLQGDVSVAVDEL